MEPVRVGIIGCGNIYQMHAHPLSHMQGTQLAAVCDILPQRAEAAAGRYGCAAYTDYKDMIENAGLQAVHICLPHYLHPPVAIYAMEQGLDVVTEKPMGIAYADALRMRETSLAAGRRLGVIFQNRYNPGTRLVKEALDSGRLGKIYGMRCEVAWHRDQAYYDSAGWRGRWDTEGGGVIINQAIHTLDLMRWFAGREIESIAASIAHRGPTSIEVEDTAEGLITFAGGLQGLFYLTVNYSRDARTLLELDCEKGTARLDAARGCIRFADGQVEEADEDGSDAQQYGGGKDYWGFSHYRQIRDFYEDPTGETADRSCQEALLTQAMICGIYEAARKGQTVRLSRPAAAAR
ncbi:MAG TPA: Gfo/Idh/MocA family oxidoreductase [Firmicutes bacterium]|nr:Gfo/Idh/MocA family oxidoreductase [Bacillota bacterium]